MASKKHPGTKVRNPMHRASEWQFVPCIYCGALFTRMGISKHWAKCKSKPGKKRT